VPYFDDQGGSLAALIAYYARRGERSN